MAFSEAIKNLVKKRAAFRCCRCQTIGIDVHHIIPEKDGGSDDISNAAPLCQNCHSQYGDNPLKRKEISQMRDWWYEKCEQIYPPRFIEAEPLNQINSKLDQFNKGLLDIAEMKSMLRDFSNRIIENLTPETLTVVSSSFADTSVATARVRAGNLTMVGESTGEKSKKE